MSSFVLVETPGGPLWAEIDTSAEEAGIQLTSRTKKQFKTFEETANALKKNAQYLLTLMEELSPEEIEVSCGIKIGAEGGTPFFGLAKASGEASYSVTIKWKAEPKAKRNLGIKSP